MARAVLASSGGYRPPPLRLKKVWEKQGHSGLIHLATNKAKSFPEVSAVGDFFFLNPLQPSSWPLHQSGKCKMKLSNFEGAKVPNSPGMLGGFSPYLEKAEAEVREWVMKQSVVC